MNAQCQQDQTEQRNRSPGVFATAGSQCNAHQRHTSRRFENVAQGLVASGHKDSRNEQEIANLLADRNSQLDPKVAHDGGARVRSLSGNWRA
jgi:hypothetical protein